MQRRTKASSSGFSRERPPLPSPRLACQARVLLVCLKQESCICLCGHVRVRSYAVIVIVLS